MVIFVRVIRILLMSIPIGGRWEGPLTQQTIQDVLLLGKKVEQKMIKYVIVTTYEWAIELNDASRVYSSLAEAKQELRRLYNKTIKELEDDEINDETFNVRGYYDEYEGKWASVDGILYSNGKLLNKDTINMRIIEIEV